MKSNHVRTANGRVRPGQLLELSQLDVRLDVPVSEFDDTIERLVREMRAANAGVRIPTSAEWGGSEPVDPRVTWVGLYATQVQHSHKMGRAEEFLMARRYSFLKARAEAALRELGVPETELAFRLKHPTLDASEFRAKDPAAVAYAQRAVREMSELRNRFVEGSLYMVIGLANRYRGLGVDLPDLIQEGNASLFQAIDGFDWRRDVRFKTYAQYWIHQAILKVLYNASRTVRVPIWVQKALRKIRRVQEAQRNDSGQEATSENVGAELGMSKERVDELLATRRYAVSLDAELAGSDGASMGQLLADERLQPVHELVADGDLGETLRDLLGDLPPREKLILNRRFGLLGNEPETLAEIATDLGITAERVRQLQNAAIARLQKPGSINRLKQFE
jgi:RNA polymerase primary sigma factor